MAPLPAPRRPKPAADGGDFGRRMETLRDALLMTVSGYTPAVVEMFTDDVEVISPVLVVHDRDALVDELRRRNQVFSDIELELQATELADDRLLGEWQLSAVLSGHLELPEFFQPPTSGSASLRGVTIARFFGSQIRELHQYWDGLNLLSDLGVVPVGLLRSAPG
jgi:hypothetical protein